MILSDREITELCLDAEDVLKDIPLIQPFVQGQVKTAPTENFAKKIISYGLSSYGYDIRVGNEFKIFTPGKGLLTCIDPKNFNGDDFMVDHSGDYCIIPPNSFALCRSIEYIRMPRDITGVVLGKSTYARCGIVTNFTPLEAGWEGHITIEISNTTPLPAKIYSNEGIAQVLFFRGARECLTSYADRGGKYQGQTDITLPKV